MIENLCESEQTLYEILLRLHTESYDLYVESTSVIFKRQPTDFFGTLQKFDHLETLNTEKNY